MRAWTLALHGAESIIRDMASKTRSLVVARVDAPMVEALGKLSRVDFGQLRDVFDGECAKATWVLTGGGTCEQ